MGSNPDRCNLYTARIVRPETGRFVNISFSG